MNFKRLYEQLKIDEGVIYEIYHDHLGYHTFGVGHLVKEVILSIYSLWVLRYRKKE